MEIQQKIISSIEVLEAKEKKAKDQIEKDKETIINLFIQLELKADKEVRLSDGKSIALAVSFEMDRTGKEYRSEIIPDVIIKPDANKDLDLETAQKWILE